MPCITLADDATTHLYAKNRSAIEGAVNMYYYDVYTQWSGAGTLTLPAHVTAAGEYEVAVCCSATVDVVDVTVRAGGQRVGGKVGRTCGVWREAKRQDYNFERVSLPGTLKLPAGPVDVVVAADGKLTEKSFNVSSVELTPVAAKTAVATEEAQAVSLRSSADWFSKAGYGLMFHWTDGRTAADGTSVPYPQAVADFNVVRWAGACAETGAAYVFLTANHGLPHFPGPLKFWESVNPGSTTKRDLVAEMADALEQRGLRLCLYLNCPTFGSLPNRGDDPAGRDSYLADVCGMFEEIGGRYGEHVAGYWLDSWYQPYIKWGRLPIHKAFRAAKTGWADRVVAFNHWTFPVPTQGQEFWAGEVYQSLVSPAETRQYQYGAGRGLLYHNLFSIDSHWGQCKVVDGRTVDLPIWPAEVFGRYVRDCMAHGGVTTVNLGIYQDGTLSPETAATMRQVGRIVRG